MNRDILPELHGGYNSALFDFPDALRCAARRCAPCHPLKCTGDNIQAVRDLISVTKAHSKRLNLRYFYHQNHFLPLFFFFSFFLSSLPFAIVAVIPVH